MKSVRAIWRFLKNNDGYMIASESVIVATLTVCALVVGVAAVRVAVLFVFIDAAESLASRENLTPEADVLTTDTIVGPTLEDAEFPTGIGSLIPDDDRPQPVDASKE